MTDGPMMAFANGWTITDTIDCQRAYGRLRVHMDKHGYGGRRLGWVTQYLIYQR
jgi:hypothetical protein